MGSVHSYFNKQERANALYKINKQNYVNVHQMELPTEDNSHPIYVKSTVSRLPFTQL